ncbi:MAG: adenine deaminase [Spirochaeta sp. LUC14_002_19_P3]|nr:MAG: adenine deaminase [Spirochaeta sp. LUC14_002_19_P3]
MLKYPMKTNLKRFVNVAAGREEADLVLKNARVVNVFTREIAESSIAVNQGKIAGIGNYRGREEVDLGGRHVTPGLIDSHVHIESALVSPEQFARLVVPRGTTAIVADPHEIANVRGLEGIRYMVEAARGLPLDVYYMVPSCVPATRFENAGAVLDAAAIASIMGETGILGLGEMMDYPSVIRADDDTLAKLAAAENHPIDGHCPMLEGFDLAAYAAAGIHTDHECSTVEEMNNRLRLGMRILIREGSAARNLKALIKGVNNANAHRCSFCTDDKQPEDIFREGHIDYNIRLAVECGLDVLTALQMATLNAALGYGLRGKGAIAPGYDADIAVLDNLETFRVHSVYKKGVKVAENGESLFQVGCPDISAVSHTVKLPPLSADSFALRLKGSSAHVIQIQPNTLITPKAVREVRRNSAGFFAANRNTDVRKIAVIERHRASGSIGLGLVEGYGVTGGAVGLSIGHDSHNLVICGDCDGDMRLAAEELERMGGGIVLVKNGALLDTLPLPIAGLMSNRPADEVNKKLQRLNQLAYDKLHINKNIDPVIMLSFLTLPVIPELKITDKGLFDVKAFDFIEVSAG